MASPRRLDVRHARKVLAIVDQGLVCGVGVPEPGKLCVEAAVCLALGLPHGDDPNCVAAPDRAFKIALNDAEWSTPIARAQGLRNLAVAQLGTRGLDRWAWVNRLIELTIRRILPIALRAAGLETEAIRCEVEGTGAAAEAAARAAWAAWAAEAAGAAEAAEAAEAAGAAGAAEAAGASRAADAARAARAAAGAARAAAGAADAAWAAWAAADAADAAAGAVEYDRVLRLAADCAEQAYRDTGAPGIKLLDRVLAEEVRR